MPTIRLATQADGPRLAEIYRPAVEDSCISFEDVVPDGAEMGRRIMQVQERTPWIVAEDADLVLGYAYASRHRERPAYAWSVESSIYVDLTLHRSGIGRRLYGALFDLLAWQGFQSVFAGIVQPNPVSAGFHRSLGFTEVGTYRGVGFKAGGWRDTLWLQRQLNDHPVPPPAIRALPQLADDPAATGILPAAHW